MNESLLLRFRSSARPLTIKSFRADEGVVFDEHPDASPLNLAVGLQPLFPQLLEPVRQRNDWRNREFRLDAVLDSGGLRFSGFNGDPLGFPAGVYDITVEVESFRFKNAAQRVILNRNATTEMVLDEEPDLRRVRIRPGMDSLTTRLIGDQRSEVDGQPLGEWLNSERPRAARQACLLNILAKLRVPVEISEPRPEPLAGLFDFLYFADVDRVYAGAKPGLLGCLDRLVETGRWVKEGRPAAKIHERLLDTLDRFGVSPADARRFPLISYRQGGRNCLQVVVASPPPEFSDPMLYADIDIDLGNPLWDLQGLLVHLGEVLDSGRTDHFALHSKLDRDDTKDFLYYDIAKADAAVA